MHIKFISFRAWLPVQLLVLLSILSVLNTELKAQTTTESSSRGTFSVEIDPATFVLGGYSLHLRWQPAKQPHLQLGAGLYAMDMPDFLIDLNASNKGLGWSSRLDRGLGLFGEYHFQQLNQGWFAGVQLGTQRYELTLAEQANEASYTAGLLMGYGGYSIQPFSFPLYLKAWGGLGYTQKVSGGTTVGEQQYDIAPITIFMTLHMGYSF